MYSLKHILVGLICFVLSVILTVGYDKYKIQRLNESRHQHLSTIHHTLSPSETLRNYWQASSENRIEDARIFTGPVPQSYWIRCIGDNYVPNEDESSTQTDSRQVFEMDGNMYWFTRLLQANHPSLDQLRVVNEWSFDDEAVVEFIYLGPPTERAFLKRGPEGWKLFTIDSTRLEFMRVDEYARKRQPCSEKPTL